MTGILRRRPLYAPVTGGVDHAVSDGRRRRGARPVLRMLANNALRGIFASLGVVHAGPIGALAGLYGHHQLSAAATALGERSAAGRVARSLYRSPAQNAAEARFVDQMGRYGALGSRMLATSTSGYRE